MPIARKRPSDSPPASERWSLPFAGFLLLVLAVFAVLYARARADAAKLRSGAGLDARELRTEVPLASPASCSASSAPLESSAPADLRSLRGDILRGLGIGIPGAAAGSDDPKGDPGLERVADRTEVLYDHRGLVVRLASVDFFDDGEAAVRPELRPIIDRIGKALAGTRRQVRVEGHTDAAEDRLDPHQSGWELSAARASWVVRYWVARFKLDPGRFSAAGYSHFRPLSGGTDAWSRGRNRRIEVIVLADGDSS